MPASAYIGRVGRLAVALGVGTAVFTGHGIAAADDTDTSSSSTSTAGPSAESSGPQTGGEQTTPATGTAVDTPTEGSSGSAGQTSQEGATTTPAGVVSAQTNTGSATTAPTVPAEIEPEIEPDTATPDDETAAPSEDTSTTKPKSSKKSTAVADTAKTTQTAAVETTSDPEPTTPKAGETFSAATTSTAGAPEAEAAPVAALSTQVSAATTTATTRTAAAVAPAAAPNPFSIVTNFVSGVVNSILGPLVGSGPAAPAGQPMAWTLLAYARREIEDFVNAVTGQSTTSTVATQQTSLAMAAARAVANVPGFPLAGAQLSPSTSFVNWVTGGYQVLGANGQINPLIADTLTRFGVSGTDVGTMWDNGIADDPATPYNEHQVLIAFGDTFGLRSVPGEDWRFNVLMRSADTYLADGMDVPDGEFGNGNWFGGMPLWDVPNGRPYEQYARRIINPEALPPGLAPGITLIPTAGIALPSTDPKAIGGMTQYLSFMSVRQWGAAGQWTTNYSGIAYSIDNGENWKIAPQSIRMNDPWSGNANFQQAALVRPGDGYVYSYGTPNGRQGAAYLSRVAEKDILDVTKYDYYSKGSAGGWFGIGATKAGWYRNQPAKATAVFGASEQGACGAVNPGVQVSELSVQYNKQLNKYVTLYGDQFNNIVMRTSDTPQGTWSSAKVLMSQQQGGIYAPMMHPWSPSTMGTGSDLYWNLSIWSEYNVMLMKTDLTKV
ncbi:DUF4185 domain-containing protein [Mycolicibacterium arenosum]|uniref:DUF4185 domain-containing protein n=1 Tax=Mycolicibacterium arenosum TaxID=2952157 RepID=A0ABT1LWW4_9MYCO|nr:DUF4185 domain-containing protein [Mycolicibacterium sp. CAU 1645]MCP9271384.1 DUF4185 domain-containing protein [Mycolicibacterium sp. CAU 1645]